MSTKNMSPSKLFEPIGSSTLRGRVAQQLTEAILQGRIRPGVRLNEAWLAREFRVSRAPIREALDQLQEQGLIESNPRRGRFVVTLQEQDIRERNSLRVILEAEALRLCRLNLTPQGEKRLVRHLEKMDQMEPKSIPAVLLDLEFHRTLWEVAGSRYLEKILVGITIPLMAHAIASTVKSINLPPLGETHRPLLKYVLSKSDSSSEQVMREHLSRYWGERLGFFIGRTAQSSDPHEED